MNSELVNEAIRVAIRSLRTGMVRLGARVRGKAFLCSALQGESGYNICVNCDMTVSCNCRDWDGSGHIGDLSSQSLREVFESEKVRGFRAALAEGRFPILTCASCPELKIVPRQAAARAAQSWRLPHKGIMVENTIACPYSCTACSRSKVTRLRRKLRMSLSDIERVSTLIREHRIEHVSFFNLGEPFADTNVLQGLKIIRERNPTLKISISTNGLLLNSEEKREAALLADCIWFSIDGVDDKSQTRYQRGAAFDKVYANLRALVEYRRRVAQDAPRRTHIEWKYVLFNWNDRKAQLEQAVKLAEEAGVDAISFWPTNVPLYGISWRYRLCAFHRNLGTPSWKGREVSFER